MTRDDVLKEFYATPAVPGGSSDRMADEILRLRAILAMLKKPDIDVLASAMTAWSRTGEVPAMLHAALTIAEQEVRHDEG